MQVPSGLSLLGVNMLFVAFVLYIIALNLQGKVGAKETAVMCIMTGGINVLSAFYNGFILGDTGTMAGNLLFGCTYIFFAMDILMNSETFTGLGNYALCGDLACIPYLVLNLSVGDGVLAFFWILWGQLWGAFWVANGLKKDISAFVAIDTYIVAIINFIGAIGYLFGWIS